MHSIAEVKEEIIIDEKLEKLLKDSKPVDIEIGFGKGQFVIEKAKAYKDINFVGFEVKKKLVKEAQAKIDKLELENIYIESTYANVAIPQKIPHGRVRFMYVNFPDPWWKKRHKKRRILQPEYIKLFYDALQLGGIIYVRTDVKEYEEFVLESFTQFDTFEQVEHDIMSDGIKSNREVRCISEGLDLYYLAFKKIK